MRHATAFVIRLACLGVPCEPLARDWGWPLWVQAIVFLLFIPVAWLFDGWRFLLACALWIMSGIEWYKAIPLMILIHVIAQAIEGKRPYPH